MGICDRLVYIGWTVLFTVCLLERTRERILHKVLRHLNKMTELQNSAEYGE